MANAKNTTENKAKDTKVPAAPAVKAPETLEEALEVIAAKDAEIADLMKANKDMEKHIEELNDELDAKAAEAGKAKGAKVIPFGKKKYEVVIPSFSFEGENYTASDLETNEKLVEKLLGIGSGVLKEV
jgi:hypothetical protein